MRCREVLCLSVCQNVVGEVKFVTGLLRIWSCEECSLYWYFNRFADLAVSIFEYGIFSLLQG